MWIFSWSDKTSIWHHATKKPYESTLMDYTCSSSIQRNRSPQNEFARQMVVVLKSRKLQSVRKVGNENHHKEQKTALLIAKNKNEFLATKTESKCSTIWNQASDFKIVNLEFPKLACFKYHQTTNEARNYITNQFLKLVTVWGNYS